jgi:hypothetical protein
MRTLRALGLVVLGVMGGAGFVAFGSSAAAQIPSSAAAQIPTTDELNARFVVGKAEYAYSGRYATTFRFLKDKQTGDCYLSQVSADKSFDQMLKTDDDACSGF